ncbi:MAG: hypothetical protein PHW13_07750 [Methylococcales bacterium]|nr:hypothetical protein [Methylococcales bacterium]
MSNPTISSVSYNASSGVLTVTGSNLGSGVITTDLILYGSASLTLTKNDIVSNASANGFNVTLSSADRVKAGTIFPVNGAVDNSTTTTTNSLSMITSVGVSDIVYELYAAAGWDSSGSLPVYYTGPLPVSGADTLSAHHYKTSLTLSDTRTIKPFGNLTLADSDGADRVSATLTLTAANGVLNGNGLSAGTLAAGIETYTLAAATPAQLARELRGLTFTPTAEEVAGGNNVSNKLTLNISGSSSSLDTVSISQTETIKSSAPGITGVRYDAADGILTVSGVHLHQNPTLGDFSVTAGGYSYTLNGNGDLITKFSRSGFTLQLGAADQAGVNGVFTNNGNGSKTAAYTLAAASGWDGGGNPADTAAVTASYLTLSMKGVTAKASLMDTQTVNPFQHLVLSDSYNGALDTATIGFSAANGALSGAGLSAATVSSGVASYTLAAASPAALQQALRNLVFTPTLRQALAGKDVATALTLTVSSNDSAYGNSATLDSITNTQTVLTVHGSQPAAEINAASYNAYSGILTVTGRAIGSSLNLGELTLSNGSGSYTLGGGDTVLKVSAGNFSIQLGNVGQSAVNALFSSNGDLNGKYLLTAATGWDGAYTLADSNTVMVSHNSVTLADALTTESIKDNASSRLFAKLMVSGGASGDTLTASISYPAADGSLHGPGLSGSAGGYTLTADSAAALQRALQTLVFTPTRYLTTAGNTVSAPVTMTVAGTTSALDSTYLLDTVKITATAGPTISGVAYNAATGVLTVTGSTLAKGVVLADLTLSAGSQHYTLTNSDSLSKVNAGGFSVVLNSAGQAAVNAMFADNGTTSGGSSYTLATTLNWDGAGATAASHTVTVSGDNSIAASGLSGGGVSDTTLINPFANLTLSDSNVTERDSATISFTAGNGTLAGNGLSAGTVANGVISYTLAATSAAMLQGELAGLQFTPTAGISSSTQFNLNFSGSIYTPANKPTLNLTASLNNPVAVATNGGDIFVASHGGLSGTVGSGSVAEYSASGQLLRVLSNGVSLPSALAVDSQGNVYVGNYVTDSYGHGSVEEFAADGSLVRTFTGMTDVQSVAVDGSGNLFVACLAGNINAGKGYVEEFAADGTLERVLTTGISKPISLAIDNTGDVFVASYSGNSVREFSASGTLLRTLSSGVSAPVSVTTDKNGDVFVVNANSGSGIYDVEKFSASGTLLLTLNNGFKNPVSVATDSYGDVFVADKTNNSVSEFSASGQLLTTLSSGIANPWSVSTDSQGNVYVANQSGNSVEEFSPVLNSSFPTVTYSTSVTLSVTANATSFNVAPNDSLSNLTVISKAASGDTLTIADAGSFNTTALTTGAVTATGGDATQLSAWVAAALSTATGGGDLAQHGIEWFNFDNNTYLLEQANTKGAAYGGGDTLIELVGVYNEAQASFNATTHTLTL